MRRSISLGVLLLCALVVFTGQGAHGQLADRAEITGLVTDTSRAGIPDAKVTITNQDTGAKIVVGTDLAGNYNTPPIPKGTSTIEMQQKGFKPATHPGIVLTGAESYRQE